MGVRSRVRELLTVLYEHRLARALLGADTPKHVGVIMDGNRRWARAIGLEDVAHGHRRGAEKIVDLLGWCDDAGVQVVTLFLLSTDNLSRPEPELSALLSIIEDVATDLSRPGRRWQLRAMGALELLPAETAAVLKRAEEDTRGRPGASVNLAVGYGGRRLSSRDGMTWENDQRWSDEARDDDNVLFNVAYGLGRFIAVGGGRTALAG